MFQRAWQTFRSGKNVAKTQIKHTRGGESQGEHTRGGKGQEDYGLGLKAKLRGGQGQREPNKRLSIIAMPPIHHELPNSASRLAVSECAYVILNNGDRGIIVPPGASGKMITVRLIASRAG